MAKKAVKKNKPKMPSKGEGVYDIDDIRYQLKKGFLGGDAIKTLEYLLQEYDSLDYLLNKAYDDLKEIQEISCDY